MPSDLPQATSFVPPRPLVLAGRAAFALVGFSALGGLVAAALPLPKSAWTWFGFETVVAVSCLLGLQFARTGFRVAPAMGLATLGACIAVASVLGYFSLQPPVRAGVSLMPLVLFRGLAAAAVGLCGLVAAMQNDRRSWITLFWGAASFVPVFAFVAVFILPHGKRLIDAVSALGGFAAFGISLVAFLVFTAAASAGVHLIVRAFQTAGRS